VTSDTDKSNIEIVAGLHCDRWLSLRQFNSTGCNTAHKNVESINNSELTY